MKYRKKPIVIEATQWYKNGDHPKDNTRMITRKDSTSFMSEGKIVRYFRHPGVGGQSVCRYCDKIMHVHGWIDTLQGGHAVCPGDWIITDIIKNEHYPCKPDIFATTYEEV